MRLTTLAALTALGGAMGFTTSASAQGAGEAAPIYRVKLPAGYRDRTLISWRASARSEPSNVPV